MISIAIATYNGERFLREQLDSLYTQTMLPDEVIVCDDRSTDNTKDILEEYHHKYGLKYIINEQSLGCSDNFMKAFSLCTQKYVMICDQDDIWFPNKVETLYKEICRIDSDMPTAVSSCRIDVNAKGEIISQHISPDTEGWQGTLMATGRRSQGCTMIMNHPLVNKVLEEWSVNPKSHKLMYDSLIAVTAAIFGKKKNLGAALMYYRHHDKNVWDPYRGKKTFRQKVKEVATYYGFLQEDRIIELACVADVYGSRIENPNIKQYLGAMQSLATDSFLNGLKRLLTLPQIPIATKIKITLFSPLIKLLKTCC